MNPKQHLLIKVAQLYYEGGFTQEAISQKLRLSRPTVSRMLQEAIDLGIVKISILPEPGGFSVLEREIENKYGLLEAIVVDVGNPDSREEVSRELGMAAANHFSRLVQDGDMLGLTWGVTLSVMVENLQPEKKRNVQVVQLVGGLGEPASDTHATDLVMRTSQALGASLRLLPAPGIVRTVEAARLLRSEPYIAQALELARRVDIAFAGIGAPTHGSLLMRDQHIITWDEVNPLMATGAVGEIGLQFYDRKGKLIHSDLDERVIGISLETLRTLKRVVGIAGGSEKFNAILGALRGHFINILITDAATARRLIEVGDE